MKITLNNIAYGTAIGLAGFSGAIATYGLTKFCPGSEIAVGTMGALFEAAKLSSLALIHRKHLPLPIKTGLAAVSLTLMTANIAGVSGMLSAAYSARQNDSQATHKQAGIVTGAAVTDLRRQLDAADASIGLARAAVESGISAGSGIPAHGVIGDGVPLKHIVAEFDVDVAAQSVDLADLLARLGCDVDGLILANRSPTRRCFSLGFALALGSPRFLPGARGR